MELELTLQTRLLFFSPAPHRSLTPSDCFLANRATLGRQHLFRSGEATFPEAWLLYSQQRAELLFKRDLELLFKRELEVLFKRKRERWFGLKINLALLAGPLPLSLLSTQFSALDQLDFDVPFDAGFQ